MLLVASRNIHKGEEVTNNYGLTFLESNKKTRQKQFESKYHFLCSCTACSCEYPTYRDLPIQLNDDIFHVINDGFEDVEKKMKNKEY